MTADVQAFYGRWAGLYDRIARHTPGVTRLRRRAAAACRLDSDDTVADMGTGTGANLPYLRERVGPAGRVVGIDLTRPGLGRARARSPEAALLQADATRPPVSGPVDAVVATFVSGMFEDPARVVDRWCDLAAGGHVVLLDLAPSERPAAAPLNHLFRGVVAVSTPPTTRLRYDRDLAAQLSERIDAAHGRLRERAEAVAGESHALGFVRLTGGAIPRSRADDSGG